MIIASLPLAGITAFAERKGDFNYCYSDATLSDATSETTASEAKPSGANGDINGDGKVSVFDSTLVLKSLVGNGTEIQSETADLNYDGEVSIIDARWILQITAGIRDAETLELTTELVSGIVNTDRIAFFTGDNSSPLAGDTITYYLNVENMSGVYANITFDTESLTFIDAVSDLNMLSSINENDAADGSIKIAAVQSNIVTGKVAKFEFKYKGGNGEISAKISAIDWEDIGYYTSTSSNVNENTDYSPEFEYQILENGIEITNYNGSAENLEIPSTIDGYTVTSIDYYAFYGCESLKSVTIPESVITIGECAFLDCNNLTEIKVDTNNKNYSSQDGVLFDKNKTILIKYPTGNIRKTYEIPNNVTSIGDLAFYNCFNLTSIKIPSSVTSIGYEAFENCDGLTSVVIPNGVTSIDYYAFYSCNSLKSVTIPESVTSIYEYAFRDCDSLTEINVDANNKNYSSQEGVLFDKNKTELIQYPVGNAEKSYDIPASVTIIGDYAFDGCCLTSVTIPESVIRIGDAAFSVCDNLTDIYILNKDCNIVSSSEDYYTTIPTETTIHGYAGSTAQEYANKYGNKFVALEEHPGMAQVPAKAATCTEDGNIEYYHCPDCNKNFKDKDGNEEVTDIVVKATGHKYENGVCTVCGEKEPVNPSDPTNPDTPKPTGEVSGDGRLSTVDAKWILQNIAKSRDFSDEQSKAADLNGDGKLSVVDVKWVLQIVAGMRDAETLELITK